jgi:preprotein translocase subunit SecE
MRRTAAVAEKKDQATAEVSADPEFGDVELSEAEQVAAAAAGARPTRKQVAEPATGGKGRATPKRTTPSEREHRRATPVQFVREVVVELKKVVWPTWDQLRQYFVVVLVFVLIMIAIVFGLDLGFGAAILKWLG